MTGIEDKVFNFGKQKHAAYFMKNCEAITKYVAVKYKHGGPQMSMVINKIKNQLLMWQRSQNTQPLG